MPATRHGYRPRGPRRAGRSTRAAVRSSTDEHVPHRPAVGGRVPPFVRRAAPALRSRRDARGRRRPDRAGDRGPAGASRDERRGPRGAQHRSRDDGREHGKGEPAAGHEAVPDLRPAAAAGGPVLPRGQPRGPGVATRALRAARRALRAAARGHLRGRPFGARPGPGRVRRAHPARPPGAVERRARRAVRGARRRGARRPAPARSDGRPARSRCRAPGARRHAARGPPRPHRAAHRGGGRRPPRRRDRGDRGPPGDRDRGADAQWVAVGGEDDRCPVVPDRAGGRAVGARHVHLRGTAGALRADHGASPRGGAAARRRIRAPRRPGPVGGRASRGPAALGRGALPRCRRDPRLVRPGLRHAGRAAHVRPGAGHVRPGPPGQRLRQVGHDERRCGRPRDLRGHPRQAGELVRGPRRPLDERADPREPGPPGAVRGRRPSEGAARCRDQGAAGGRADRHGHGRSFRPPPGRCQPRRRR